MVRDIRIIPLRLKEKFYRTWNDNALSIWLFRKWHTKGGFVHFLIIEWCYSRAHHDSILELLSVSQFMYLAHPGYPIVKNARKMQDCWPSLLVDATGEVRRESMIVLSKLFFFNHLASLSLLQAMRIQGLIVAMRFHVTWIQNWSTWHGILQQTW